MLDDLRGARPPPRLPYRKFREPPEVLVTVDPGGETVRFRCKYCRGDHMHGNVGLADGRIEHRCAHCWNPDSPYTLSGYILRIDCRPPAAVPGSRRRPPGA